MRVPTVLAMAAVVVAGGALAAVPVTASASPAASLAGTSAAAIWGAPQAVLGNSALGGTLQPSALSCDGPGDCVAVGLPTRLLPGVMPRYGVAEEKHGVWGAAFPIPGLGKQYAGDDPVTVDSLSCGAPGNCVLGGEYGYVPSGPTYNAFIDVEKKGTWAPVEDVPGLDARQAVPISAVDSVSCPSSGNCLVGGDRKSVV